MNDKKNVILEILKTILYVIVAIILVIALTLIYKSYRYKGQVPDIFGYKFFIVVSGSMEPTINIGDVVVIKDTENIKVNDIISFKMNGSVITHRVQEITTDEHGIKLITKGDANNTIDGADLLLSDIEGKYIFKISKLGNVILFLRTPAGLIGLVAVFGLIIAFNAFRDKKKDNTEDDKKE